MFGLTQRDISVDIESELWNITHEPARTHVLSTHTHTHLNPGLHGDCFSAHVNLPPASVSVCSLWGKKPPQLLVHNHMIVFSFSTHCSLSTINKHNKYHGYNIPKRNKYREQTVPHFLRGTQCLVKDCPCFTEDCRRRNLHVCHWCTPSSQPSVQVEGLHL